MTKFKPARRNEPFTGLLLLIVFLFATFIFALVYPVLALSDGQVYTDTKPFECTNPTTLTDGTPLTDPIEKVEIYVSTDTVFSAPLKTVVMNGGCTRLDAVDITDLAPGQYQQSGRVFVQGREASDLSLVSLPFVVRSSAKPNPPVMVQ